MNYCLFIRLKNPDMRQKPAKKLKKTSNEPVLVFETQHFTTHGYKAWKVTQALDCRAFL